MKICPYCGEEIPTEINKCPYCAEWLMDEDKVLDENIKKDEIEDKKSIKDIRKKEEEYNNASYLIEEFSKFVHRKWYSKCLQKDYTPTFLISVMLHDDKGKYTDGRFLASGSTKIIKFHAKVLSETLNKEKGEFIKW